MMELAMRPGSPQTADCPSAPSASPATSKKDYWLLASTRLATEEPKLAESLDGIAKAAVTDGGDIADNAITATNRNRERLVQKRWHVQFRSKTITIREQFDKILTVLKAFKDIGSAVAGLDPIHAGLPWAGICLLMQLALGDSEQYAAMVADAEEVASIISRYRQIEILYLQDVDVSFGEAFEARAITLYMRILKFEVMAAWYYQRNTMSRFVRAVPKLDDSTALLADIRKQDLICKDMGQIFDSKDAQKKHQEILALFKTHDEMIAKMMKELQQQDITNVSILRWISDFPFDTSHQTLKIKLEDNYEDSGKWLLEDNADFQEWRCTLEASALFWLHGRVGTGKSSIAYLTTESLTRHKLPDERIAYFYCIRNEGNRAKPDEILRSILRQVSWSPVAMSVAPVVEQLYHMAMRQSPGSLHSAFSLSKCMELLESVSSSAPSVKLVIDALDECADYKLLLQSLLNLSNKLPGKVRIFVTGRESLDIRRFVHGAHGYDVDNLGNAKDVESFIDKELERRAEFLLGGTSKDLEGRLRDLLIARAYGMFKWVELQLAIFLDQESGLIDREDVVDKLDELELRTGLPDLNTVYDEIYERNTKGKHSRSVANRAFKWILCLFQEGLALSFFNPQAFAFAVSIEPDGISNPTIDQDYILRVCGNFLILDPIEDRFRYAHLSVFEYLVQRNLNDLPAQHFDITDLNAQVAETCLRFLNRTESYAFADRVKNDQYDRYYGDGRTDDFFALYAFYLWPFHCNLAKAQRLGGALQEAFHDFLWRKKEISPKFRQWVEYVEGNLYWTLEITSTSLRAHLRNVCCSTGSPLFLACTFDYPDVLEDLVAHGKQDLNYLNSGGKTALEIASAYGYEDVVRCLIKHGANIEATVEHGKTRHTALFLACESGRVDVVRILLENGAKVNEAKSYVFTPRTALHVAAELGHEEIVDLLLMAKADPNARCRLRRWADWEVEFEIERKDDKDLSSLEHLVRYTGMADDGYVFSQDQLIHREKLARELLAENEDKWDQFDFILSGRWTPLHKAVLSRNTNIIENLIKHGADINARAALGETALHMATDTESLAIVRWMLDHGASLNARSKSYGTPLMYAGVTANESMVGLLLSAKEKTDKWSHDLGEAIASTVMGEQDHKWLSETERKELELVQKRDEGDEDERPNSAKREAIIRLMLQEGADIEVAALIVNMRRMTDAFDQHQLDCYQMFGLESSTGTLDIPGVRPLYISALLDDPEMTQLLIELGAKVDAKDVATQMPALYEAAARGHEKVVRLLLDAGADPNAKGGKFGSILSAASKRNREGIVKLLLDHGATPEDEEASSQVL